MRIVGTGTGTTVTRTIAVTAAPTTSTVKPTLKVKVTPGRVTARETRAKLVVTVAATLKIAVLAP